MSNPIPIQPVKNPVICKPYYEPTHCWEYERTTGQAHKREIRRGRDGSLSRPPARENRGLTAA